MKNEIRDEKERMRNVKRRESGRRNLKKMKDEKYRCEEKYEKWKKKVERMKADLEWKDENDKDWKIKKEDKIYFRLEMKFKPCLAGNM